MDLSVIIVNWNVRDLLSRLLDSIFHFSQGFEYEVIVIDNDSRDGTVHYLKNNYQDKISSQQLKIIDNQYNAGFAKANNQGLKISRGKYVLFMNPDMELMENSFLKLIQFMNERPNSGICACRLLYSDKTIQPNVKDDPTFLSQLLILFKLHHFLSWLPCLKKYLQKNFDYSEQQEVKQAMGAFIFTRKALMDKINGWDEDYWLWWEEVELCKRARNLGYKIFFLPITEILHYEAQSFDQTQGIKKQKRFNRGMLTYFKKHHSKLAYFVLYLCQPVSLFLTLLKQLFKIKPRPQSRI